MNNNINKVISFLKEDIKKNVNLINFTEKYPIDKIKTINSTVLIRGKSDHDWVYLSSDSKEDLNSILDNNDLYYAAIEDWMIPLVVHNKEIDWQLNCIKLIYSKSINKSEIKHNVRKLTVGDAEYIYNNSHYNNFTDLNYIKERIENGISFGIDENGHLIGWIMTHDDGAIGFLNILEDYRGNGYAKSLTISIIYELQSLGKLPFVHIEKDNIKSMTLSKRLGFKEYNKVSWIKLK